MSEETLKHTRPGWDQYFMNIVGQVAGRATCDRGRSGCIIVRDRQILTTGYVGSPVGISHCDEIGHEFHQVINEDGTTSQHCIRTTHAEQNAICQAAKLGVSINGATIYCKMTPCYNCAKMIINVGIKRIVCEKDYHASKLSKEIFQKAGVVLDILDQTVEQYEKQ
ncbi:MAG: cytidine/deoxycytidylate deaminase family protein [Patescibacteria group bacterium]